MVNRLDHLQDGTPERQEGEALRQRLKKLQNFQAVILKHALKFPNVHKVVYSTCSVHEEENEQVVRDCLKAYGNTFKLVKLFKNKWPHRGLDKYDFGDKCVRVISEKDFCNSFFIACFKRIKENG